MTDFDELAEPAREFLRRSLPSGRRGLLLAGDAYDGKLLKEMADEGWFSLAAPASVGGLEIAPAYLGPIARLVGEQLVPGPILENLLLPSMLAPFAGEESLKVLDKTISGGAPIAFIDAMPPLLWSPGVEPVRLNGDVLSGVARLVRFGAHAASFVVVCPDAHGIQQVALVDAGSAGVSTLHQDSSDPLSSLADVQFTNVTPFQLFDDSETSGTLGDRLRAWLRVLCACELSGGSRAALQLAVAHAGQRQQFGRALSAFQAVQHIAADMHTFSTSLENLCQATLDDLHEGVGSIVLAGASTLAWAGEVARRVCEESVQLHGGIGFTQELDLHWYYKHALYAATWLGDREELETEIGRKLLNLDASSGDREFSQAAAR